MSDLNPDDDAEQLLWEQRQAELTARSDADWWEQDHLSGPSGGELNDALKTLQVECGCDLARLLSDLREIEQLSEGYSFFLKRRELPRIIKRVTDLQKDCERIEMSSLAQSLPEELRGFSEAVGIYSKYLELARQATERQQRPQRARRILRLLSYVDDRTKEYGDVGKRKADEFLAVLLTGVTYEKWTADAIRVARARYNEARGKKRIPRDKRKTVRWLRGSRARARKSREVPFDDYMAETEGKSGEDDESMSIDDSTLRFDDDPTEE